MILVSMERRDPTLYNGTKQLYFGPVNFKCMGVVTTPFGKPCYKKKKKGLVGRGLIHSNDQLLFNMSDFYILFKFCQFLLQKTEFW